jgi:hypothetical protein
MRLAPIILADCKYSSSLTVYRAVVPSIRPVPNTAAGREFSMEE